MIGLNPNTIMSYGVAKLRRRFFGSADGPSGGSGDNVADFVVDHRFVTPSAREVNPYAPATRIGPEMCLTVTPRRAVDDLVGRELLHRRLLHVLRVRPSIPRDRALLEREPPRVRRGRRGSEVRARQLRRRDRRSGAGVLEDGLHRTDAIDPPDGANAAAVGVAERSRLRDLRPHFRGLDRCRKAGTVMFS